MGCGGAGGGGERWRVDVDVEDTREQRGLSPGGSGASRHLLLHVRCVPSPVRRSFLDAFYYPVTPPLIRAHLGLTFVNWTDKG